MDHAQIHVVGVEAGQKILEGLLDGGNVADAEVAAVAPGRAKMALDDPLLPFPFDGVAQVRADVRLGHEAVQHIDALLACGVHYGEDLGIALSLQPLAADGDLADAETGFS
jgi:hypothetical protein